MRGNPVNRLLDNMSQLQRNRIEHVWNKEKSKPRKGYYHPLEFFYTFFQYPIQIGLFIWAGFHGGPEAVIYGVLIYNWLSHTVMLLSGLLGYYVGTVAMKRYLHEEMSSINADQFFLDRLMVRYAYQDTPEMFVENLFLWVANVAVLVLIALAGYPLQAALFTVLWIVGIVLRSRLEKQTRAYIELMEYI